MQQNVSIGKRIWNFIVTSFAAAFGVAIFLVVSFFLLLVSTLFSSGGSQPEIKSNSILKLSLTQPISERTPDNPLEAFGIPADKLNLPMGLWEIRKTIRAAAKDDNIKGIYLDLGAVTQGGWSSLNELRLELKAFKESGKFIMAYGETISEKGYYVAALADEIYLNPQGFFEFNGLSSEVPFFAGTFEKLGIRAQVFKVGTFKSAVEPFILDKMSEPNRAQVTSYLNSLHDHFLKSIAADRGLDFNTLKTLSDSMTVRRAEDALTHKLVTNVWYYDQVEAQLRQKLGIEDETEKLNFVSLSRYAASVEAEENESENKIAVIIGEGEIVSGKGSDDQIGSDVIAAQIRKARLDENVKAIVLRINSPGGSALASDVMWREVQLAKEKKPIIASMSDVAASGGYYMAMGCNRIFANENTITGSIGIFGLLFETEDFFKDKLGVTFDRVNTGELSALGMPTKNFSQAEKDFFQELVNEGYENFTSKAAQGRKMPLDSLKNYAEGRVWTGQEAIKRNLVDEFGGLDAAIAYAAKEAKVEDYKTVLYPEKKDFLTQLLEQGSGEIKANLKEEIIKEEVGESYQYLQMLKKVFTWEGIQARAPIDAKNIN
ncbi:signal peptide peptidase SppA [Hugenholtzia roseola]|uniref:signal peptide peptidase SppA n=1 Tax=Hugenholtzia roseola TaxID=1002 RepID=UPI000A32905D|nr:signal peptide peptidase SppA [Hugenholtzia roseola]